MNTREAYEQPHMEVIVIGRDDTIATSGCGIDGTIGLDQSVETDD